MLYLILKSYYSVRKLILSTINRISIEWTRRNGYNSQVDLSIYPFYTYSMIPSQYLMGIWKGFWLKSDRFTFKVIIGEDLSCAEDLGNCCKMMISALQPEYLQEIQMFLRK